MRRLILPLLLMLSACSPPATAAVAPPTRYDLRALPLGNLFYQLDCLAGQGYCSEGNYRQLWQSLGWDDADAGRLQQWQQLKARYSRQVQLARQGDGYALPPRFDGVRLWDKVRQAAFNATDAQSLAVQLAAVMRPQDAEQLASLLLSFDTRFEGWWQAQGRIQAEKGAQAFAQLLQQQRLPQLIEQAGRFYHARLSDQSVLAFNFLARPDAGGDHFNGEQVENQSLIELRETGPATANLDVALHEFCHYLYARGDSTDEKALIGRFARENRSDAIGAYNLLNEVLATAIGNGLAGRLLDPDRFNKALTTAGGFYDDAAIDPLAKAVYTRVEQALEQNESLYDESFLSAYLALARQTLGERLSQPQLLLRTMALAYEGADLAEVQQTLQRRLRAGAIWGANALDANARSLFEGFSALSGVLLLKPEQRQRLQEWESLLGKTAVAEIQQPTPPFIYGIRRNPASYVFVLVASNPVEFTRLIETLATAPAPFIGKADAAPG